VARTVTGVRTESIINLKFQFGHLVINPHWHDDAEIIISVSGELCGDPADPSYLRGPDFVTFRSLIARYVEREIEGSLLVWAAELDCMEFSYEMPQHRVRVWPFPPTAETLAMLVASEAVRVAELMGSCVESVEMWESVRSGIRFDKDAVLDVVQHSRELLRSLNPSLVSAAYQGHNSLF
jgi:hypothetical protein